MQWSDSGPIKTAHGDDEPLSNSNCTQCLSLSACREPLPPGPDPIGKETPRRLFGEVLWIKMQWGWSSSSRSVGRGPFALCINIPLHGGWWCFMYFVLLFFCDLFHLCSSHLKLINFLTYADLLRPLSKDKFVHGIPFQDAIVSFAPILYNQPSMTRKISSGRSMQSRGPVSPVRYGPF